VLFRSKYIASETKQTSIPIQLIRPQIFHFFQDKTAIRHGFPKLNMHNEYQTKRIISMYLDKVKTFILENVNISCCGVALDSHLKLYEIVPQAFRDCIQHTFKVNPSAEFFDMKRTATRAQKLLYRNWAIYDSQEFLDLISLEPMKKRVVDDSEDEPDDEEYRQ
jgi:hypothetical protein